MTRWLAKLDWQTTLALLSVAAAAAYLVRRSWRAMSGTCNKTCGKCIADIDTGVAHKPLVQLELPSERAGGARR